jgi:shikimate dehydrogenase
VTRLAGIIGHPVAHSLSPVFQAAAFAHCGLDVRYERWDTPPTELEGRVAALRSEQYLGANVTIPHKEAVLPLLDELAGLSARVGAVNTIVKREGRLLGYNTDGPGFVAALRHESGFEPANRAFLLVGAGGAARGIACALAEAGAVRVAIANRTASRAATLAEDLARSGLHVIEAASEEEDLRPFDCVVNCTSVGMHGGPDPHGLPLDVSGMADATLVVDIVYAPELTPLLAAAQARGLRTLGGLPMLVYQGALSFELWTGLPAPLEVMFAALRTALAGRTAGETR